MNKFDEKIKQMQEATEKLKEEKIEFLKGEKEKNLLKKQKLEKKNELINKIEEAILSNNFLLNKYYCFLCEKKIIFKVSDKYTDLILTNNKISNDNKITILKKTLDLNEKNRILIQKHIPATRQKMICIQCNKIPKKIVDILFLKTIKLGKLNNKIKTIYEILEYIGCQETCDRNKNISLLGTLNKSEYLVEEIYTGTSWVPGKKIKNPEIEERKHIKNLLYSLLNKD